MKRLILISFLLIMASAAALFAQDAAQPQAQVQQETKKEVKQPASNGTTAFTLGEIVVRDRNIPNIEDASTTTDISGKDIENRGDKSLADTLQMVPGLTVSQHAKGFTGFQMRGQDHEKVAILVDGIPILDPYYGGNNIDISTIPVSNVSRVVVNRGATSALYGALGAIGSINIITKKPEKLTAAAKVEYGQHQNYTINAEAGAPIGNFYAWVTASMQNSNGYEISGKLDRSERKAWFDKLVSYRAYSPAIDYSSITLKALTNYLDDDGVWNNTSYRKYSANARLGYNFSNDLEAGVSVSWYNNKIHSNTFQDNSLASFGYVKKGVYTDDWSEPTTVNADSKKAIFTNRAFNWPEDTRLSIAPYVRAEFGDLKIRANAFYVRQRNNLEGYFDQDQNSSTWMFPGSTAYAGQIQSIFEEQSFGFNLLPSYQINSWNKLSAAIHYRLEQHNKYENAIGSTSVLATTLGSGDIHVQEMEAHYFTVAVEDQMNLNTAIGALNITLGISYDAQNFTTFRYYDDTANSLTSGTFIEDDNTIWGTRDSFNPVIAALYDPIKDFLRIRTAFAMKTNFPTLETYKDIGELMEETPNAAHAIEPERIYSYNGGFELFFLNNALSFRCDYFYTVVKDKIESIYDPNSNYDIYTNLDSVVTQGVENTVQGRIGSLPGIASIEGSLSYIYTHAENQDSSRASYGEDVEDVPQHQFIAQLIVNFITNTSLTIWGSHTRNQLKYVMAADPSSTSPGVYTQDVYTTVELHNPFMLHIKVQQDLPFNTYVYVMCKNILDDYDANPFNPGPGRMFYFGGGGRL